MLDRPLLQVIEDLVAGDPVLSGDRDRPLQLVDVEVADAPGADLPVRDQVLERLDRAPERMLGRPVEEVDVEVVRAKPSEARLAGSHDAGVRGVPGQHLRDQEDLVAPAGDRLGNDLLDPSRALHLGRVDVRHAGLETGAEGGHGTGPVVALEIPRPLTDDGNRDAARAEGRAPHRSRSRSTGSTRSTGSAIFTSAAPSKGVSATVRIAVAAR